MNPWVERLLWLALAAGATCLVHGCAHQTKPDDMSAAAHRSQADRERDLAESERKQYKPAARAEVPHPPSRIADETDFTTYNPTQYHLAKASKYDSHAKQHLAAAAELERFEDRECEAFSVKVRGACPVLGPIASVEEIRDGVRLRLQPGAPLNAVLAHMRCHLAYARARGFETAPDCPLYLKGTEIRPSSDGLAIEIVAHDGKTIEELRRRTLELEHVPSI